LFEFLSSIHRFGYAEAANAAEKFGLFEVKDDDASA
jgi:hypothetical protein